jgi:hypothetical protein
MNNMNLRTQFEENLRKLPEVEVEIWKDSALMCVFFRGKEFAHFHDHEEIDVRLSQRFIKDEGLKPLENSRYHPKRSKKSRWMQFRFTTKKESEDLMRLLIKLIENEYQNTVWGTKS